MRHNLEIVFFSVIVGMITGSVGFVYGHYKGYTARSVRLARLVSYWTYLSDWVTNNAPPTLEPRDFMKQFAEQAKFVTIALQEEL